MRNPFKFSSLSELFVGPKWASTRPDVLRRQALLFNTVLILTSLAVAYPVGLYLLWQHGSGVFLNAVALLTVFAIISMAMHRRRLYEMEVGAHVGAIGSIGMILTVADPDIVDFGLAVTVMAPLYALLLSQSRHKQWSWAIPVLGLGLGALANAGILGNPFAAVPHQQEIVSLTVFVTTVMVVAVTANRMNTIASASSHNQMKTFSMLVESVKDAVVRYNAAGEILFLSKSAGTLFACQRYELNGNGLFERIHILDRPGYLTALMDAGTRGIHTTLELRMRRDSERPGEPAPYIWVELSLSPVADAPGMVGDWEIVGVLRDVSVRKDVESAMDKARRDAEQASEAKSRFLAMIGHELRTPLNAIVGFSDMMKAGIGGTLTPGHDEYAGLIRQSGQHLLEVVNMLLDMSKIEAGRFEVNAELFGPANLIEPCVQMVERQARDRGITLALDVPERLPSVMGDERAIRQVLINLLSNAIKFSHNGGTVELSMRRQGKRLNISVRDSGIGMGAEIVRRIGEPFLQAQDSLARRYEGTGLGLSIVKGLVDLHEGQLHVSSEAGVGTTVTILLPLDGPTHKPEGGLITPIHSNVMSDDELKWLEDEKRCAAV